MKKVNPHQFRTMLTIIWGALFSSHFTFALVAFMTRFSDFSVDEMLFYDEGKLPFIILAGLCFVTSFAVVIFFRKQSVEDGIIVNQEKYQMGNIITWAITENITILGLVVSLTRNSNSFLPFLFVGVATMLIHFPKELYAAKPAVLE